MTEGPTTSCDRCGQQFLFAAEDGANFAVKRRLRSYGVDLAPWDLLCWLCLGEMLQDARRERLSGSSRARSRRG